MTKTAAQLKQEQRERRRQQGFVAVTFWVHEDDLPEARRAVKALPKSDSYQKKVRDDVRNP